MRRALAGCVAGLMVLAAVKAADAPLLKEGYWSIHTVTIDQPGDKKTEGTRMICRSHAYDEHTRESAKKMAEKCAVHNETFSGGTYTSESECTVGASVIHTKGTATVMGDTASHSESHATFTPPAYGTSETTMIIDQRYVGACPAGAQPGDMFNADGTKMRSRK